MTVLFASSVLSQLSDEIAAVAETVKSSFVSVYTQGGGNGSGIIWGADGTIVTNHHVVPRDQATVRLPSGETRTALVINRDQRLDLAVLQVKANGLKPASIGDSSQIRVGDMVLAIGNPWGVQGAVTVGMISGVGKRFGPSTGLRTGPNGGRGREIIQADISLAPGNSGGPLLDAKGRVIGINAMVSWPGMALAVPSNVARNLLYPKKRATLGVKVREVTLSQELYAKTGQSYALLLVEVTPSGAADAAGLMSGDVLLSINGDRLESLDDLLDGLEMPAPNTAFVIEALRGGQVRLFSATTHNT